MSDVKTIYDAERRRRAVFYSNPDGSFGFREEYWRGELENAWVPKLWPNSRCDTLQRAVDEAVGRIKWLAEFAP